MEKNKTVQRNMAIDLLRVIAIFLVLWQHASEYYYIGPNLSVIYENCDALAWLNSASRTCVPLFVMISGYFLLPVKDSTRSFFKRRFTRILFPWIVWCVCYAVYYVFYRGDSLQTCLGNICRIPLNWGVEVGHLWYIYMLIGLYLLAPVISPWLRGCSKRELQGYLCLWGLTTLLPYLHGNGIALWGEATWNASPAFYYFTGFAGYFILGHYLRRYGNPPLYISALLLTAGYFITAMGFSSYATTARDAVQLEIPWDFCSLNVAMMTAGIFAMVSSVRMTASTRLATVITSIATCSYAIYLVHIMVLNYFHDMLDNGSSVYVLVPAITLATFVTTYVITWLLGKLPYSRYWLGTD